MFSGTSSISRVIEIATGSKFSHVAMVYRHAKDTPPHFTGDSTFFCAELIAYVFQEMNMLAQDPPANWYDPKAFGQAHQRVTFTVAAKLGKQVRVKP